MTTTELQMIQRMMGVDGKPVNPFPLPRSAAVDTDQAADAPSD